MSFLTSGGVSLTDATGHPLTFADPPSTFALTAPASGGWSWFADPRAIYSSAANKTFFGYAADLLGISSMEVRSYDHATRTVSNPVVLQTDAITPNDHGPPVLLRRASDGRILAVYHNDDTETIIYTQLSTNPDDVSVWGSQTNVTSQVGTGDHHAFNLLQLTGEASTPIYLCFTGKVGGQPNLMGLTKSVDNGSTWAAQTNLYVPTSNWVYYKAVVNGTTRIDFTVTDNHPTHGATSVYHFYYQSGSYHKSDGTLITASLPFDQTAFTKIYDGTSISGWIWDIAIDPNTGYPIVVFVTFPGSSDFRYQYARWNGSSWIVNQICTAGGYLYLAEPNYAGGVYLDHESPNVVYASRNVTGQWEMSKLTTADGGATWTELILTAGSTNPQLRPMVPRGHAAGLSALWLNGTYTSFTDYNQGTQGTSL